MRRMWPEELDFIMDGAEEVTLDIPAVIHEDGSQGREGHRQALKVRLTQENYERIWPHAETRYRLGGRHAGKAITLIANNPHYHAWHPSDGGTVDDGGDRPHATKYVVVHFLLDDVSEDVPA